MNPLIIEKLKNLIMPLSVNQVKCISPKILQRDLQINNSEYKELIEFLYEERILYYRFQFLCSECNNECIAYERVLKVNKYVCGECGKRFDFSEVIDCSKVVYEIKKDELMKIDQENSIDYTQEVIKSNIIKYKLHEKPIFGGNKMKEREKVIFFGSSTEAVDIMDEVAAIVGKNGFVTRKWNSPNIDNFQIGGYTLESLIKIANEVDGAIFIFNKDDKTWLSNVEEESQTVRDNVLFEYGLFMGILGKDKVAIANQGNTRMATDLKGITYIDMSIDESVWEQKIKFWLKGI